MEVDRPAWRSHWTVWARLWIRAKSAISVWRSGGRVLSLESARGLWGENMGGGGWWSGQDDGLVEWWIGRGGGGSLLRQKHYGGRGEGWRGGKMEKRGRCLRGD